jgi:hypothetical protein
MRTKTLLLAAALTAAGIASIQAQSNVYSVNVVGYYNVTIPSGTSPGDANRFKLFTQQLRPDGITSPTLNNSLTNLPAGTIAYVWTATGWSSPTEFLGGTDGWETDHAVPYGSAVFLKNTAATPITVTVVGEVAQGSLTNSYPAGYTPKGPLVPQAGGLTTVHKFSQVGDKVYSWGPGWSAPNEYLGGTDGWENGEPNVEVGAGFMISSPAGGNWVNDFTVPE